MDGKKSPTPSIQSDAGQGAQPQQPPKVQPSQEPFLASPLLQAQSVPSEPKRGTNMRSQATSNASPVIHQPQPLREAVDKAFDQSPTNQLDPAFIAQVTEAVVKSLQSANLTQATPAPPQQSQYPPPPSFESAPQSPTQSSTASLPARYTPPSPRQNKEDVRSYGSVSPGPIPSDSGSTYSFQSGRSKQSQGERDGDTPRPAGSENSTGLKRSNTGRQRDQQSSDPPAPRRGSATESAGTSTPLRRDSQESATSAVHVDSPRSRARPTVLSPVEETTTLERIWQPLFNNGNPTLRLGQFLRGLAIHLIDDYEPKGSLVVTPAKMLRFFDETSVDDEIYPWATLFGGKMTSASISVMYRRLLCQHHLIQAQNHEIPSIPGLTPAGFEWFMTCLIQAHPDTEFERLAKAVMNMPISNADNKTERFPKELSRRLLPALANPLAEQRIIASMAHETQLLQLRNSTAMPPPPASAPPQQQSSFQERERKPYSHTSFSNAVEDDDLVDPMTASMPSMPIERERKPYFAKEGSGKLFDSDGDQERPNTSQFRPDASGVPFQRPNRQNSGPIPQPSSYNNNAPSDPRSVPPPSRHRTSMGSGIPPAQFQTGSYPKGRRSPPPLNTFARSDPSHIGDIPPSQYASNIHHPRTPGGFDRDRDQDGYRRGPGSGFEDDVRGKPIPSRPPPGPGGYDSAYSSATGAPPPGSYPIRPRTTTNYDDRRRSMYGGTGGGTDGWGSFANGNSNGGYPPPQQGYGSTAQH